MKSNLSVPGMNRAPKKKVVWADEKNQTLENTLVFEVDESELADMHEFARQCAINMSMVQAEKSFPCEPQNLLDSNSFVKDDKPNSSPLPPLIRILLPDTILTPKIRLQEQDTLQSSYMPLSLFGSSISNEPKLIPLENVRYKTKF